MTDETTSPLAPPNLQIRFAREINCGRMQISTIRQPRMTRYTRVEETIFSDVPLSRLTIAIKRRRKEVARGLLVPSLLRLELDLIGRWWWRYSDERRDQNYYIIIKTHLTNERIKEFDRKWPRIGEKRINSIRISLKHGSTKKFYYLFIHIILFIIIFISVKF